jgi:hypothetical protein
MDGSIVGNVKVFFWFSVVDSASVPQVDNMIVQEVRVITCLLSSAHKGIR